MDAPDDESDEAMRSNAIFVDTMFTLAKDVISLLIDLLVEFSVDTPKDQTLSLAGWYRVCFLWILLELIYLFGHTRRAARTASHCSQV